MPTFPVSGGCLCGSVRYTVSGPALCVVHCHSSICRRIHASLVATGATIERENLSIDKGEANLTTFEDLGVRRQFCRTCGSSLFYFADDLQGMMFYYPSRLDGGVHPGRPEGAEHHVHVGSKADWECFEDNLSRHKEGVGQATLMKLSEQ